MLPDGSTEKHGVLMTSGDERILLRGKQPDNCCGLSSLGSVLESGVAPSVLQAPVLTELLAWFVKSM